MSEVMTSGIETIHIRLLDEPVEVWRPAQAFALGSDRYRLADQDVPADEAWEFQPGEEVVIRPRGTGPEAFLAAVALSIPKRLVGGQS